MAYLALAREGEFGTLSFWQVWVHRIVNSPVQYGILLFAAVASVRHLRFQRWYLPFLVYFLWVIVATVQITAVDERYISSIFPAVAILGGITLATYLRQWAPLARILTLLIVTPMLLGESYFHFAALRAHRQQITPLDEVVGYFRTTCLECKNLLVNRSFFPTLQCYFPEKNLASYSDGSDPASAILSRLQTARFDGIVYQGSEYGALEKRLQAYLQTAPQTVAIVAPKRRIVFYRLSPS
jgi:hypothetical protein